MYLVVGDLQFKIPYFFMVTKKEQKILIAGSETCFLPMRVSECM